MCKSYVNLLKTNNSLQYKNYCILDYCKIIFYLNTIYLKGSNFKGKHVAAQKGT